VIVKIIVEKQIECRLAGEIEVLGENLHQFVHHKVPHDQTREPRMIGEDDCGEIGRINIGRGNRSTRRKLSGILGEEL
jgi:hypothetical protein